MRYQTWKDFDDAEEALKEAFPACLGKSDTPLRPHDGATAS
jgi:hypothetical protein